MKIFPAIDIIDGCAVRLSQGDYDKKTVYNTNPLEVAKSFADAGSNYLHIVDLDGAKSGGTPNLELIKDIVEKCSLKVEIGGGIRSMEVVGKYINAGAYRVILGTAAVKNPDFLKEAVDKYGEKIAVGVDIKDGKVAVKGWTELSEETCFNFCEKLEKLGVASVICTDISKDGLLEGTNLELYKDLTERFNMEIIASGGVSSIDDVQKLKDIGVGGAILGKALYTGHIKLEDALKVAKGE